MANTQTPVAYRLTPLYPEEAAPTSEAPRCAVTGRKLEGVRDDGFLHVSASAVAADGNGSCPDWRKTDDFPPDINERPSAERNDLVVERVRLLHVHGQGQPHDEVVVAGNTNGLTVLRDMVAELLAGQASEAVAETYAIAADGESYRVVGIRNDRAFGDWGGEDVGGLPYLDPVHNPRRRQVG